MNSRRREFITLLGDAAAWLFAARAQQDGEVLRIGMLDVASETVDSANIAALRRGLQQLDYVEGRNVVVTYRYARGGISRCRIARRNVTGRGEGE